MDYKKREKKPRAHWSPFIKVCSNIQGSSRQRPCVNSVSRIRKNTVSSPARIFPRIVTSVLGFSVATLYKEEIYNQALG